MKFVYCDIELIEKNKIWIRDALRCVSPDLIFILFIYKRLMLGDLILYVVQRNRVPDY